MGSAISKHSRRTRKHSRRTRKHSRKGRRQSGGNFAYHPPPSAIGGYQSSEDGGFSAPRLALVSEIDELRSM